MRLNTAFESINGGVHNASITVESESEVLYSWEETTDEGCVTYSSTADRGEIRCNYSC